jgi:hypothetical protein
MEKLKSGIYPYAIAHTLHGDYIVDGRNWIPVASNATAEHIKKVYEIAVESFVKTKSKDLPERQWQVSSSRDSSKIYNVRWWLSFWTCECEGYQFRKNCRHIERCKEQLTKEQKL